MATKGKMPPALAAYWAKKRGQVGKAVTATKRKARSVVTAIKTKRRSSGGGGGRGIRGVLRGHISRDALLGLGGTAVGITFSNQIAPRIATKIGGFWASDKGQLILKIGMGIGGGAVLSGVNKPFAAGFSTGAMAEPLGGLIRSVLARGKAASTAGGVQGLAGLADAGYEGVEGTAYEGVEGLAQYDYAVEE